MEHSIRCRSSWKNHDSSEPWTSRNSQLPLKKTLSTNKFSRRKGVHRRNPCNFFSLFYYNQGKHGIENVKLRWKKEREITGRDAGRAAFLRERRKARDITGLEKKKVGVFIPVISKVRVDQTSKDQSSNAILIADETHLCDDMVGPAAQPGSSRPISATSAAGSFLCCFWRVGVIYVEFFFGKRLITANNGPISYHTKIGLG